MTAIPVAVELRVRMFWGLHHKVIISPVIRMGINQLIKIRKYHHFLYSFRDDPVGIHKDFNIVDEVTINT